MALHAIKYEFGTLLLKLCIKTSNASKQLVAYHWMQHDERSLQNRTTTFAVYQNVLQIAKIRIGISAMCLYPNVKDGFAYTGLLQPP